MAEEETKGETAAEAPAPAPAPAPGETTSTPANGEGNKRGRRPRENDKPIEELYDLSQPIPRADRPDKAAHEKELDTFNQEFEKLKGEREKVQAEIDGKLNANKSSEIGQEKEALIQLRKRKGKLIDEKKSIRAKLDSLRSEADKLVKDRKDTRSSVKYTSAEQIDAEIAKLTRRQETTSMTLTEEKKLIQEINSLKKSKDLVADLKSKETSLDDVKEQRKVIAASIAAKDKEIDAVQAEIDVRDAKITALRAKETDKRDQLKDLFNKRDELRKATGEVLKKKDECRAVFRKENDVWYNYQRAVRAQKKMQYEEEKRKREEAEAEWRKEKEAEEAKKIPYEAEQALCDYLADYLTRTYLMDSDVAKKAAEEAAEAKRQAGVVAVKDDPFAGFKPVNKKTEDEYFGKGKGKKKRTRPSKEKKATAGPFTLSVDTFEQFGLLQLAPPVSLDQVPKSVEALKAKKKWYSEQPRGSVLTATEIRKANEKAAAKLRHELSSSSTPAPSAGKAGTGKFALTEDDFAPLNPGGGGGAGVNAKWGQKNAGEEGAENGVEDSAASEEA